MKSNYKIFKTGYRFTKNNIDNLPKQGIMEYEFEERIYKNI